MLEKLWNDIRLIYEGLNFSSKLLIDHLMIISGDNYYLIYYIPDGDQPTQIRIEKHYRLTNMWSDDNIPDVIDYKIYDEVGDQIYTSQNSIIEKANKIITPFLREYKLNKIIIQP